MMEKEKKNKTFSKDMIEKTIGGLMELSIWYQMDEEQKEIINNAIEIIKEAKA